MLLLIYWGKNAQYSESKVHCTHKITFVKLSKRNVVMEDHKKAERRYNITITALILALIVMIVVLVHYKLTRTDASQQPKSPTTNQDSETKPAPTKNTTAALGTAKTGKDGVAVKKAISPALQIAPPKVQYDDTPLGTLVKPTILIEKSKLRLTVFNRNGQIVKHYRAAVGANSGDKLREGDFRTPEGEFYVCVKNPNSKYVLALGLSYPGISDAERGYRGKLISKSQYDKIVYAIRNRRQPPWNTPLGGEIMIHGRRNGGRDTEGCIALEDKDIRELYPQISVGTRVVIKP
jgi:hypothetical protein